MKITKLRIKELFGIKEYEVTVRDCEIIGKTGAGKTAIIDSIRYALENKSERQWIVKQGADEGEIFIETDTGLSIYRKNRPNKKTNYISVKDNGVTISNTETFLRNIFTPLQLDPIKFIDMKDKEQDQIILDLVEYPWDLNWIKKQFGEIVPEVNYQQHLLRVLYDIEKEDGYYFQKRQNINRDIRNNKAIVVDIKNNLPPEYKAEDWKDKNLSILYTQIEEIRSQNRQIEIAKIFLNSFEGKKRQAEAEREIKKNTLDKEMNQEKNTLEQEIVKLKEQIKNCENELSRLEDKKVDKIKIIDQEYENKILEYTTKNQEYLIVSQKEIQPVENLVLEAEQTEKMKNHIPEYNRMIKTKQEIEDLVKQSNELTDKIELARKLPGQILAKCKLPFTDLTIENGKPFFKGLPISNLSSGEKLMLCIDITREKENTLALLLIDGIEKLSPENQELVYKKCKETGIQFIATRTTGDPELIVVEL